MPKCQIDYSKTIIYKIQHKTNEKLLYVGQTTDFYKWKCQHKSNCKIKHSCYLYTTIYDNGGWDMFEMKKLNDFPCKNKQEAEAEEKLFILELSATMNTLHATRFKTKKRKYHKKRRH